MDIKFIKGIVETLLFITDKPLSIEKLVEIINDPEVTPQIVAEVVKELQSEYAQNSALEIRDIAGGVQFATKPQYSEYVRRLYRERVLLRLSPASIETLAIIAYRQPITKAEIEEIRGVDTTSVLETLLERRLIKIVGRKEVPGRPLLYGTTQEFLKYFGLNSLTDLPPLDQFLTENIEQQETVPVEEKEQTVFNENEFSQNMAEQSSSLQKDNSESRE